MTDISKISNGTNTYDIKDATARSSILSKADDSNVVHKTGDENIAGDKTFSGTTAVTGQLQVKSNNNDVRILNHYANYTKGTAPSATQYSGVTINDKNGTEMATFYGRVNTNNINSAIMLVKNPGAGVGEGDQKIAIHYPENGTAYTEAPTPATSDNSTKIATTAFVKAQGYTSNTGTITGINMNGESKGTSGVVDLGTVLTEHQSLTNYVTTNTTQTISKTKTFTDSQIVSGASKVLKIKNTSVTRNTAPSSAVNAIYINGLDNADKNLWGIYGTWSTTKQNQVQLICYKGTSTDNTYTGIGVGYDSSGNAYTYAPTPAVSDSSTKIATTAYVNNKFKVVTSLPASPDANTIYFIKE